LLSEHLWRKRKVTRNASKAKVKDEEAKPAHPDERPGAIGSLFSDGE
jgi:hypothetical protein